MKLIQKSLLNGSVEFELTDDAVNIYIKSLFKKEHKTVVLVILNPEPVINKSYLEFHSRVKCGPLLSFRINKPNEKEFTAFVNAVKEKALKEYNAFSGIK